MTSPHGNALRMQLALSQLGLRTPDLHVIPLLADEPTGNVLVSGIASTPTVDLQHMRFAPRCFPLREPWPPLLLKHDNAAIAGTILSLRYDSAGRLLINAELTHPLAKRMSAFSVGVSVGHFTMTNAGACVEAGELTEVSVTDCPANPECLITHRYPPCANVEFYNIIERGAQLIYKIAQVAVQEVIKAQRAPPPAAAPRAMVHCSSPPKPPTQFAQLVQELNNAQ